LDFCLDEKVLFSLKYLTTQTTVKIRDKELLELAGEKSFTLCSYLNPAIKIIVLFSETPLYKMLNKVIEWAHLEEMIAVEDFSKLLSAVWPLCAIRGTAGMPEYRGATYKEDGVKVVKGKQMVPSPGTFGDESFLKIVPLLPPIITSTDMKLRLPWGMSSYDVFEQAVKGGLLTRCGNDQYKLGPRIAKVPSNAKEQKRKRNSSTNSESTKKKKKKDK
jgi:hypothetical protein